MSAEWGFTLTKVIEAWTTEDGYIFIQADGEETFLTAVDLCISSKPTPPPCVAV